MINKLESKVENRILKYEDYKGNLYLYDSNSNYIFKHTDILEDILTSIYCETEEADVKKLKQKYPDVDLCKQIDIIINLLNKEKERLVTDKIGLNSLWMNISHECNLRCIYCYGTDGTYGTHKTRMTVEEAKKTIDYWFSRLDKKAKEVKITFFGGEPTINKNVIAFSVKYINELLNEKYKIKYRITTNGTLIDIELLEIFQKNNFSITVSLDGDEKTHNKNRPFSNGNDSFQKVISNILYLQKNGIKSIAARLTILHKNVINLENNVNELWSLGVNNIALNIVASTETNFNITNEDIKCLQKQIHNLALEMLKFNEKTIYNISLCGDLLHHRMKNKCLFYSNQNLLVETNGDVFRCHRLVGNQKFNLGNIFTNKQFEKENVSEGQTNIKCKNCWANKLCTSCPQINNLYNNDIDNPYEIYCAFNKIIIEEGIKFYTTSIVSKGGIN